MLDQEQKYLNVHIGANGDLYDPVPGDGDGQEYLVREWYNKGWDVVYRHPDEKVGQTIAALAIMAANNDNIGYNNSEDLRVAFWNELTKVNYDPSAIKTQCTANCSSSTVAVVKAAGELLNIDELKQIPSNAWTAMADYPSRGFESYTSSDYTQSTDKLKPGDILNQTGVHIVVFVGNGEVSGTASSGAEYEIDDITINLDEQEFEFSGTPKTVIYAGNRRAGEWIFDKISQFIDFIVSLITRGILMSLQGWAMSIQGILDASLKFLEGN